jgi:glycosyltransferase involved in cell wall biosynthesis
MNDVSLLCPNVIGLVVGDGPERSAQEHKMRNPAMFRFVGWQHELGVYYGAADVVCLTSDNEGMPIALIEGALSGLPAVTTAVGSAAEVVIDQKTGFVVPASDTGLFASLVGLLAKDESLRAELGRAANVHANQTFGGERLARDHALTYERLIEEARR